MQVTPSQRPLLDARGYPRTLVTLPEFHRGRAPRNKGRRYPADPPPISEIVQLIASHPDTPCGRRNRALMLLLWRSGLRIAEALALGEQDLDERERSILVRSGKNGKRRVVGMDDWGWEQIRPWLEERESYPVGPLFCVLEGPTAGRQMRTAQARQIFRSAVKRAGIRRRIHPHALRHALACELAREDVKLVVISRQLGHANLAITTTYLQGIAPFEVIQTIAGRQAPMVPATTLLG